MRSTHQGQLNKNPSTQHSCPLGHACLAMSAEPCKQNEDIATAIPVASHDHEDRRLAARRAPSIKREWQNQYLRIIVVGESGTGKSTFINNLFHAYKGGPVLCNNRSINASTPASIFRRQPEQLCTSFVVENEPERIRIHYSVQDTPGYGDSFDIRRRLEDIIQFIKNQQAAYFELEKNMMTDSGDPRVDVCLYFIPPHRLKEVDVEFMKLLAISVPLIPIIAKADSMTEDELEHFRDLIIQKASDERIAFFEFPNSALHNVLGDALDIDIEQPFDGAVPSVASRYLMSELVYFCHMAADLFFFCVKRRFPPFAVVSSEQSMPGSEGPFWPVRRYRWGTCEAFNRQHSDCSILKRLLLEEGFHELKQKTRGMYTQFKVKKLDAQNLGTQLSAWFCAQQGWKVLKFLLFALVVGGCIAVLLITQDRRLRNTQATVAGHVGFGSQATSALVDSGNLPEQQTRFELSRPDTSGGGSGGNGGNGGGSGVQSEKRSTPVTLTLLEATPVSSSSSSEWSEEVFKKVFQKEFESIMLPFAVRSGQTTMLSYDGYTGAVKHAVRKYGVERKAFSHIYRTGWPATKPTSGFMHHDTFMEVRVCALNGADSKFDVCAQLCQLA